MKTPNYYKGVHYKYEAHEVIEDFAGDNYNIGVALAYLMRAGKKENNSITQDLEKAIDHLKFELKRQKNIKQKEDLQILEELINENTDSTYKQDKS